MGGHHAASGAAVWVAIASTGPYTLGWYPLDATGILIGGMATNSLSRITFDGKGGATPAERWAIGHRIRDVAVGPDGAVWLIEDANPGGLFRVTPK